MRSDGFGILVSRLHYMKGFNMETISNLALIQAVKASQLRRNEAVEAERIRKSARDRFVRYFSKFSLKG